MKRTFVLLVLLGVYIGVGYLQQTSPGLHNPITLAAIGFVMLAAFTVSELGSAITLPRVTGYILCGVILGPSAAKILVPWVTELTGLELGIKAVLSEEVVEEMRIFNTLALGLIATGAGLELDAKQIRAVGKTLTGTIFIKIVIAAPLVGVTLIGAEMATGLLGLEGTGPLIATALVIGTLAIGTSPAIALAVMNENRARGRLMDLVLGAAVMKDLVVVVCLAIAVAVAKTQLDPSAVLGVDVLQTVALHLGEEILAGAILGVLLILYVRYVGAEMLLFVAAMILVVSEIVQTLHLQPLLVFITSGFVVRNFSEFEHDIMHPLEMVSLPVFVVFFTTAGANIDLAVTWTLLPLALGLCAVRAGGYFVSSWVGGAFGGESQAIKKNAWLGYLPQAGVTLGLTGVAATQLASTGGIGIEVGTVVNSIGMAVVALNLLVGPITLRLSLKTLGEIPESQPDDHEADAHAHARAPVAAEPAQETAPVESLDDAEQALDAAMKRIEDPDLVEIVGKLHASLDNAVAATVAGKLAPWTDKLFANASESMTRKDDPDDLDAPAATSPGPARAARSNGKKSGASHTHLAAASDTDDAAELSGSSLALRVIEVQLAEDPGQTNRSVANQSVDIAIDAVAEIARDLHLTMRNHISAVVGEFITPLEDVHRRPRPGDPARLRAAKVYRFLARTVSLGLHGQKRRIPLRLCARIAVEPCVVEIGPELLRGAARSIAGMLDDLRQWSAGARDTESTQEAIDQRLCQWREHFTRDARLAIVHGIRDLATLAATADSAETPLSTLRYSRIEPTVRGSATCLRDEPEEWKSALAALCGTLQLTHELARLRERVGETVATMALAPISRAIELANPTTDRVIARFDEIKAVLEGSETPDRSVFEHALSGFQDMLSETDHGKLEAAGMQFRPSAALHSIAIELRTRVAALPDELTIAIYDTRSAAAERPPSPADDSADPASPGHGSDHHDSADQEDSAEDRDRTADSDGDGARDDVGETARDLSLLLGRPDDIIDFSVDVRDLASDVLLRDLLPALDDSMREAAGILSGTYPRIREAQDMARHAIQTWLGLPTRRTSDDSEVGQALERADERLIELHEELENGIETCRQTIGNAVGDALGELERTLMTSHGLAAGLALGTSPLRRLGAGLWAHTLAPVSRGFRRLGQQIYGKGRSIAGSQLSQDLRARYADDFADAAEIRAYAERWRMPDVPHAYRRLFAIESLRDERVFIANRKELDNILSAERDWLDGGPSSVLLVGPHGSGRTSILNQCELAMMSPAVIRPRRMRWQKNLGIVDAMAFELSCKARLATIRGKVRQRKTAIIIDDLEKWITPDSAGVAELDQLLGLIVATRSQVFWLVAIETQGLEHLEEAIAIRQSFAHVMGLSPVKSDVLQRAIMARHRLSGRDVHFASNLATRVFGRLRGVREDELFFGFLTRTANGNLARAMNAWLRAIEFDDGGGIWPRGRRTLALGLPFASQLAPREIAILVQSLRSGPMDRDRIARSLELPQRELERHVSFLVAAGLLELVEDSRGILRIPKSLQQTVLQGLRDVGAWQ